MPSVRLSRRSKILLGVVAAIVVLVVLASSLSGYYLDYEWFGEVGQRGVFTSVLVTRLALFAVFGLIMAAVVGVNLVVAYRLRPPFRPMSPEQQNLERYRNRIEPRRTLLFSGLLVLFGVVTGLSMQGSWQQWTLWLNGVPFNVEDPQFHLDVGFYTWDYPVYRTMVGFAFTAIVLAFLLSLTVHYVFGAVRLQTPGPKMTLAARRHLTVLVFVFVVLKAVAYWLDRYELVFSQRSSNFDGASYTDVNAALPAKTILFYVAIVIAVGVFASMWLRSVLVPVTAFVVLLVLSVLANGIYPAVVQQFKVKPNANVLESDFIERNIASTRAAYGIVDADDGGTVTYQDYDVTADPDTTSLDPANPTVANIRVLDPNILSPTFTLQQNLRPFYGFPDKLDIDRYDIDGTTRDYIVSARELKAANLSGDQLNWINQYTRYTHGYGFVAAAANNDITNLNGAGYDAGGIPQNGDGFALDQPRVYYGEDMTSYALVGAKGRAAEYDGLGNEPFTYDGKGGVSLSSLVNRLAFATHYKQLSFLLNDVATADGARVIFDRDPRERVTKVAPFLKVDGDPYPVVVNGRMTWIVDGYTTTANYPYSQRESLADLTSDTLTVQNRSAVLPDDQVNYIRNSVKATVDAYDGTVTLYKWSDDPVLETWMKAFPSLVKNKDAMPTEVADHVRYPEDLFNAQRFVLQQYHVDDPSSFYGGTARWTTPTDPTQTQLTTKPNQPPYYVQASRPTSPDSTETGGSTFQLTSPMRVQNRPLLSAYVSVDSSPGEDYGKMTVLEVPTSSAVNSPDQVFNTTTTNPRVSQDISLLTRGGTQVLYGNVLTLPIGQSFLNVIPVYTKATSDTSYPILQRVIVSYGDRVGYAATLAEALANLAPGQTTGQSIDENGNSSTDSPSPTPTPSSPTSPPTSSSPPTTGTLAEQIDAVANQISAVVLQLNQAYSAGDFTRAGQLQDQLKTLGAQYQALLTSASAAPTTGSSPESTTTGSGAATTSPSATSASPSGG